MFSKIARCGLVLVVIALLSMPGLPAHAQEGGFRATFDDPDSLTEWEHSEGVAVVDGTLQIEANNFAFHGGEWRTLNLTFRARLESEDGTLVVSYAMSDSGSYDLQWMSGALNLTHSAGETSTDLGSIPHPPPIGEWAQFTITVADGTHTVAVNGQAMLQVTDPNPLPPGGIAFSVWGQGRGVVDDVTVSGEVAEPAIAAPAASAEGEAQPAYMAESWVRLGGPPGGLGYDIRMRPDNPDVMFVTASPGGIFKSTDGGQWWQPVNNGIEPFPGAGAPIFTVTINPHNPDEVWVGTQFSGHLYRSEDGGQSWTQSDDGVRFTSAENSIRGITFDPNDPNVVYMAMERGPEDVFGGTRGEVYKSTDGGAHWSLIWEGDNLARYVWIDPRDSQRIYVSTGFFDRTAHNADPEHGDPGGVGVVRSTDGGQTWEVLGRDNGLEAIFVPSLFMHPTNPDILIAAGIRGMEKPREELSELERQTRTGVYATYDGGDTWQLVLPTPDGWRDIQSVEIARADPDIWYAAAPDLFFRSEDGGQTWQQYPLRTANRGSGFPVDIEVDPRDVNRVFVNSYGGGNMLSTDGGQTWVDASAGYSGASIYGLAVLPGDGSRVIAGAETVTALSTDGGYHWVGLADEIGTAEEVFVHTRADGSTTIFTVELSGQLFRSDDGGQTWQNVPLEHFPERPELTREVMAADPHDPQVLYLGYALRSCTIEDWGDCRSSLAYMYRSLDGGQSWQALTDAPFADSIVFGLSVGADGKVYAGTMAGFYVSADRGESWQQLTTLDAYVPWQAVLPELNIPPVLRVTADPFDVQWLYAGTFAGGLWVSADGGQTWQAAVGLDPNITPTRILPDPQRAGLLYLATAQAGIFYSTDSGQSWQPLMQGLDFRNFRNLALSADGSVLYAASQGAGVFRLGMP